MPTSYAGVLQAIKIPYARVGIRDNNERKEVSSILSTEQAHSGSYSIRILGGGFYDIFYGCPAGSKTITMWVYPPVIGKCSLRVMDGGTTLVEGLNTGIGAWEQLSVTFIAAKKVYIVRLSNFTISTGIDRRAYFDDLI